MLRHNAIFGIVAILALAGLTGAFDQGSAPSSIPMQQAGSNGNAQVQPPSDAEIHARALKVIANQHRDDEALDQFERVERVSDRASGQNPRTLEDKTYRIVPTGSGTYKILLK